MSAGEITEPAAPAHLAGRRYRGDVSTPSVRRHLASPTGVVGLLVALVAIVYFTAFLANLPRLLASIYSVADTAIAPYLTQSWSHAAPGSQMLMANAPWYSAYLVMRLLAGLPDHRGLWELAPWVFSVLASGWVGWACAKVAGRGAGVLTALALICAGTTLLPLQFAWSIHAGAYVHVLLLGAFVVWLANDTWAERPLLHWAVVAVVTAVSAVGVASDKTVLVAGVVPFAVSSVGLTVLAPRARRLGLSVCVVLVTGGSLLGSVLFGSAMRADGLLGDSFPISRAPLAVLGNHALLLLQSTFILLNGYLHEGNVAPTGTIGYIGSAVCGSLILLTLVLIGRTVASLLGPHRSSGPRDARTLAMYAHVSFWVASVVLLSAVFVFSTVPVDIESKRYVVTVAYGVVILGITGAVTLGREWSRALAGLGVAFLVFSGAEGLISSAVINGATAFPTVQLSNAVNALARSEDVSVVYTGYWDSFPLGWLTPDAVPVYPVIQCGSAFCPTVSPTGGIGIPSWYRPRRHIRSMLVLDPVFQVQDAMPATAPSFLGRPLGGVHVIDRRLDVYVYGYDIARHINGS